MLKKNSEFIFKNRFLLLVVVRLCVWYNYFKRFFFIHVGADPVFEVCPTSYDYDAPISEAGDTGDKLMIIRNVISKVNQLNSVLIIKGSVGKNNLDLINNKAKKLILCFSGTTSITFNSLHQNFYYISSFRIKNHLYIVSLILVAICRHFVCFWLVG